MTLRLRLVAAIVLLATAGLVLFGVTTYSIYSNSQYASLARQLKSSVPVISGVLESANTSPSGPGGPGGGGTSGGQPAGTSPGQGCYPGGGDHDGAGGFGGHGPGGDNYPPPSILVPSGISRETTCKITHTKAKDKHHGNQR